VLGPTRNSPRAVSAAKPVAAPAEGNHPRRHRYATGARRTIRRVKARGSDHSSESRSLNPAARSGCGVSAYRESRYEIRWLSASARHDMAITAGTRGRQIRTTLERRRRRAKSKAGFLMVRPPPSLRHRSRRPTAGTLQKLGSPHVPCGLLREQTSRPAAHAGWRPPCAAAAANRRAERDRRSLRRRRTPALRARGHRPAPKR
jgi:hypothetical protein